MRVKERDVHLTQVTIIVSEILWIWFFQEKGEGYFGIWFRRVLFSVLGIQNFGDWTATLNLLSLSHSVFQDSGQDLGFSFGTQPDRNPTNAFFSSSFFVKVFFYVTTLRMEISLKNKKLLRFSYLDLIETWVAIHVRLKMDLSSLKVQQLIWV